VEFASGTYFVPNSLKGDIEEIASIDTLTGDLGGRKPPDLSRGRNRKDTAAKEAIGAERRHLWAGRMLQSSGGPKAKRPAGWGPARGATYPPVNPWPPRGPLPRGSRRVGSAAGAPHMDRQGASAQGKHNIRVFGVRAGSLGPLRCVVSPPGTPCEIHVILP